MGGIYLFSNCSSHLFAMQTNRFTMPIITRFSRTSNIYFLSNIPQNRHIEAFTVVKRNLVFHLTGSKFCTSRSLNFVLLEVRFLDFWQSVFRPSDGQFSVSLTVGFPPLIQSVFRLCTVFSSAFDCCELISSLIIKFFT